MTGWDVRWIREGRCMQWDGDRQDESNTDHEDACTINWTRTSGKTRWVIAEDGRIVVRR